MRARGHLDPQRERACAARARRVRGACAREVRGRTRCGLSAAQLPNLPVFRQLSSYHCYFCFYYHYWPTHTRARARQIEAPQEGLQVKEAPSRLNVAATVNVRTQEAIEVLEFKTLVREFEFKLSLKKPRAVSTWRLALMTGSLRLAEAPVTSAAESGVTQRLPVQSRYRCCPTQHTNARAHMRASLRCPLWYGTARKRALTHAHAHTPARTHTHANTTRARAPTHTYGHPYARLAVGSAVVG